MILKNTIKAWLPLAVLSAALCLLVYLAVQQAQRAAANDPQIQMAEDAAAALEDGAGIDSIVPATPVDLSKSLAPFLVVYGRDGKPIAGSGVLDGQLPDYPPGALEIARSNGENRVTWQPKSDVRIASVVVPYADGYVMAGRSLREVEKRAALTETYSVAALFATWLAELAVILMIEFLFRGKSS